MWWTQPYKTTRKLEKTWQNVDKASVTFLWRGIFSPPPEKNTEQIHLPKLFFWEAFSFLCEIRWVRVLVQVWWALGFQTPCAEVFGPQKHTIQTPNLRRYDWKTRVWWERIPSAKSLFILFFLFLFFLAVADSVISSLVVSPLRHHRMIPIPGCWLVTRMTFL